MNKEASFGAALGASVSSLAKGFSQAGALASKGRLGDAAKGLASRAFTGKGALATYTGGAILGAGSLMGNKMASQENLEKEAGIKEVLLALKGKTAPIASKAKDALHSASNSAGEIVDNAKGFIANGNHQEALKDLSKKVFSKANLPIAAAIGAGTVGTGVAAGVAINKAKTKAKLEASEELRRIGLQKSASCEKAAVVKAIIEHKGRV